MYGKTTSEIKFQFYLSSIKRSIEPGVPPELDVFQFYLSSIKSVCHSQRSPVIFRFQFYLSSIKSKPICCHSFKILIGFNSTLVQLKAAIYGIIRFKQLLFQFYLSSIKRNLIVKEIADPSEFQFYLSSIKSLPPCASCRSNQHVSILP